MKCTHGKTKGLGKLSLFDAAKKITGKDSIIHCHSAGYEINLYPADFGIGVYMYRPIDSITGEEDDMPIEEASDLFPGIYKFFWGSGLHWNTQRCWDTQ